jgi:uncharacterized protein (DUF885 family)
VSAIIDDIHTEYVGAEDGEASTRRWTDWSDEAFDRRRGAIGNAMRRLAPLLAGGHVQLDASLLARELRIDLQAINFRLHAFPLNQLLGVPNQTKDGLRIPFFLTNRHPLESIEDANSIVELVNASEPHLQQLAAAIRSAIRRGITLPREVIPATRHAIRDALVGVPSSAARGPHPILQRVMAWASKAGADGGTVCGRLADALDGPLRRGYAALAIALDEMAASDRSSFGVWDLPNGPEFYSHCLDRWSGTNESADALHRLGLAEIERIQDEIRFFLDIPDRHVPLAEIAERMRGGADVCYPQTQAGSDAYIERARSLAGLVMERMDRVTRWRTRAALEIRAVEPSRRESALYAEFYPATADGSQLSLYCINTGDMSRLPRTELAALTFHESVPGHHLQICAAQERHDISAFRRRPFQYESYCEGWAMYSERLGCELLADVLLPTDWYGCLSRSLWMAVRLCVDTGVHALRWSRAEAIAFFRENSFVPPQMIEQEVDRISVWPAQTTAYHIGYLAFSRLREKCSGPNGNGSSLSAFHDRLFELGPVPAGLLEAQFERFGGLPASPRSA